MPQEEEEESKCCYDDLGKKKKKAAGQNIHYLFTFKACFKVELFVETAAQVALRQ